MKSLAIAALALAFCATPASADEDVSAEEGKKIQATLTAWGCKGGDMEKEKEDPVVYEIDDAECQGGEYDMKLNNEFEVILVSRH